MDQIIGIEGADQLTLPNYGKFQSELQKKSMDDNLMEGIGLPSLEGVLAKTYEPALKVGKRAIATVKNFGESIENQTKNIVGDQIDDSKFTGSYSYEPIKRGAYSDGNRITDFEEFKASIQPEDVEMKNFASIEPEEVHTLSMANGESSFSDIAKSALGDIKSFGEGLFEKLGGSITEDAADAALSALDISSGIGFIGGLAGMGTLLGEIFKHGPSKPTLPNIMNAPQIRF